MADSILSEREDPGLSAIWAARSPSSSVGMNSPPILEKTQKLTAMITRVNPRKKFRLLSAKFNTGACARFRKPMILSAKLVPDVIFLLKNNEAATGT